jgi:hypothetical protein
MAPRDPIADLRRIAFLLEKTNEPSYRVKAFRGAAATISQLPSGELAERVEAGTLRELPGVGETTARCITESFDGTVPVYLARLERDTDGGAKIPTGDAGEPARAKPQKYAPPCVATATPTRSGRTAGHPSTRWPRRPPPSAMTTWC